MKAMCIGEDKSFVWRDVGDPVCHAEFDVRLKVEACAINRADLMQRQVRLCPRAAFLDGHPPARSVVPLWLAQPADFLPRVQAHGRHDAGGVAQGLPVVPA